MNAPPSSPSRLPLAQGRAVPVVVHETFILQRSTIRFSPGRVAATLALQASLRTLSPEAAAIVLRKGRRPARIARAL